jgi:hypothetical protein
MDRRGRLNRQARSRLQIGHTTSGAVILLNRTNLEKNGLGGSSTFAQTINSTIHIHGGDSSDDFVSSVVEAVRGEFTELLDYAHKEWRRRAPIQKFACGASLILYDAPTPNHLQQLQTPYIFGFGP